LRRVILGGELTCWEVLQASTFVFGSGMLVAMTFCSFHLCWALATLIDDFSHNVAGSTQIVAAIHEWNVLQAVLLESADTIELTMLTLLVSACSAVLLVGPCVSQHILSLLPVGLLVCIVVLAFLRAAAVTDKCARVPALINSLFFGNHLDFERQYVIDYVTNSAAGFYIYEVRITQTMVAEVAYVFIAIVVALVTRAF